MSHTNDNGISGAGQSGRSPAGLPALVFGSYPKFSDLGGQASNRGFRSISEIQRDWWHGQTFAANRQAFNRCRYNETVSEPVTEAVGDGGENGRLRVCDPHYSRLQNGMGGIQR